jgi:hypothetical protein
LPLKQRKWSSERKEMEAERMCRRRGDEVVEVGVGRTYLVEVTVQRILLPQS